MTAVHMKAKEINLLTNTSAIVPYQCALATRDNFFCAGSWKSGPGWISCLPWDPTSWKRYTSTKFELYSFHLPLAETIVWLIYHWLGVCYFSVGFGLLRNIILYAIGMCSYNYHSKHVLNKLLAKTILVSEHNLLHKQKDNHELSQFFLL